MRRADLSAVREGSRSERTPLPEAPVKSSDILRDFVGCKCSVCGAWKGKNNGFCVRCYRSLPKAMQDALWRRFGAGYEEAFIAAQKWLKDRNPQGRLPL
jgi:hypothetical protein